MSSSHGRRHRRATGSALPVFVLPASLLACDLDRETTREIIAESSMVAGKQRLASEIGLQTFGKRNANVSPLSLSLVINRYFPRTNEQRCRGAVASEHCTILRRNHGDIRCVNSPKLTKVVKVCASVCRKFDDEYIKTISTSLRPLQRETLSFRLTSLISIERCSNISLVNAWRTKREKKKKKKKNRLQTVSKNRRRK